ncbi:hypothetical protein TNCV_4791741 [Trichonephila clavipes]|nr:hypothetical protein TNCV_4791741 [Trichonephila clavipes]
MLNDEVGMTLGCLLMTINGGIGGNYETGHQRNQWFESRNGLNRDDRKFDRGYQSRNRVQSENLFEGPQK